MYLWEDISDVVRRQRVTWLVCLLIAIIGDFGLSASAQKSPSALNEILIWPGFGECYQSSVIVGLNLFSCLKLQRFQPFSFFPS